MEVLNVPEDKEEEVALAVDEFLTEKKKAKQFTFHYQPERQSLLVVFHCKEDDERLRKELSRIRIDDNVIYEVKWTPQSKSPPPTADKGKYLSDENFSVACHDRLRTQSFPYLSPGSACHKFVVEVLEVTDEDIVADYFKEVLGISPQYLYNETRKRMVLFLQSDEERAKVLCDERLCIPDYGSVCVKLLEPATPGASFQVEIQNATDEDIVIDYFTHLISRCPVYKYFKESAKMLLTLVNRAELEIVLAKEVHKIEDLNEEVLVAEFIPPAKGLKVSGIPSSVSEKFLSVYFKNETNGGGAIKRLNWDSANGTAMIFFQRDEVAERVINKGPHVIRQITLSMELIEENCDVIVITPPKSCVDEKKKLSSILAADLSSEVQAVHASTKSAVFTSNGGADFHVTCRLVVFSDIANVDEVKSNIRNSWQLQDREFELLFNSSECVGIVTITTTQVKMERTLATPLKGGMMFEKCDAKTQSALGNVHILIEQISAETSEEAVWSWLMVVTRCAAHTVYYTNVLRSNSKNAVALISFREGMELETSLAKASEYRYSIDNRTLKVRIISPSLKLMYVDITPKSESSAKRELQTLLNVDGSDIGQVDDVELVDGGAIVSLSTKRAFRKLLQHDHSLGCSSVVPYYEQLGCTYISHAVDYSVLASKINDDTSTIDFRRLVCPRLIVNVRSGRPKEDIVRKFFADRSASGGDKSANVCSNTNGSFVVTFDDPQAADRVYQKYQSEGLKLGSYNLSVLIRGMRESSKSLDNQVLVRNIGLASEDSIKYLLWALTNTTITRLTFVQDPHDGSLCAMARFQGAVDRYRLAYYCETATLDNNHLDIEPVPEPNALVIHNLPNNADKQLVKYCFEPENVADCVPQENGTWIVYFKNREHAADALGTNPCYDDTIPLSLEPYSEYRVHPNAREKGKRGWHHVQCDWAPFQILNFIKKWKPRDFDHLVKETDAVCDSTEDGHLRIRLAGSVTADRVRLVEEKFRSFLSDYDFRQVDLLPDLWNELLSSTELVQIQQGDKSVLHMEVLDKDHIQSACRIIMVGRRSAVQNACQQIKQAIRLISEERERKKQRTSHTAYLKPWIAKLLVANNVIQKLQSRHTDIAIVIDESLGSCRLDGFPLDIKMLMDEISGIVESCKEDTFEVSREVSEFMQRTSVRTTMTKKLIQAGLASSVLWCIPRVCVVQVQSLDAANAQKAVQIMKDEITETFVSINEGMDAFLDNDKWKDCADAIRGRRNGDVSIVEDTAACQLRVVCLTSDSASVLEEINNFTLKNVIRKHFVRLPRAVMQLLTTAMLPDIEKMQQNQARHYVRLTPKLSDRGENGFYVEGNADGVANMQRMLSGLVTKHPKLVTVQHNVSEPGAPAFFKGNLSVLQTIGAQTKTYVQVYDHNSTELFNATSGEVVTLPSGVVVEVMNVDITELDCDVIVNPSNEDLRHVGGLAAAIARAAGPSLVKECEDYVRQHGPLPEGQACVTNAGNGKLRCKKVVHVVGPRWRGGNCNEVNRLFQAVQNSLFYVEQHSLASVALPPISSGIFGYPMDKCADTIVESVISYCDQKKGSLSRVLLVDINDEGIAQFSRALNRTQGKDSKPDPERGQPVQKAKPKPLSQTSGTAPKTNPVTNFTLGEVCVEILNGDIMSQKADVVVSTITKDLDLSAGALSKLIAKGAGDEMNEQLGSQCSSPLNYGDIAITDGFRLGWAKVFHVCFPKFDSSQRTMAIQDAILKCFKEANRRGLKCIAVPAIGTGNLHYPVDVVTEQMYNAAVLFSSTIRSPTLRSIKFVLHHSDTYKSFIAYHSSFRRGSHFSKHSPISGAAREAAFVYEEANASAVATKGDNHENQPVGSVARPSTSESRFQVGGVNIEVLPGDISDNDSDAIVNCTNSDFSLNSQVAQVLCLKGGPKLAEECKKEASVECIRHSGVFLQKSGSLKCRYVIHVDGDLHLKEIVRKCLKRADEEHAASIAFPAIGTGGKGKNALFVAPQLAGALVEFLSQGDYRYLRRVQFVIFDRSALQTFCAALEAVISPNLPPNVLSHGTARQSENSNELDKFSPELHSSGDARASLNGDGPFNVAENLLSDLVFSVCGTEENIKEAISLLKKFCETEMKFSDIREAPDIIEELTEDEVEKFVKFGKRLGVVIDVRQQRKLITLRSMDEPSLMKAKTAIVKGLFDRRTTALNERIFELDVRSSQKQLESVCSRVLWQYKTEASHEWNNYPLTLTKKIEEGYSTKLGSMTYGPSTHRFTIDFSKNVDSSDNQLDVDVLIRRQDLDLDLPDYWNSNPNYEEVTLDSKSKEYLQVQKEFMSTLLGTTAKVQQITRVQNPHYYRQYEQHKARVHAGMSPGSKLPVERKLWHGTNEDTVQSICHGGFNRSYCGKNATVYGQGVYFARDARYSAQATYSVPNAAGHKYIMQCLVLTGEYEIGKHSTVFPGQRPQPPYLNYDTTVNDLDNPEIFVTYNDAQAYPAYIIKFHFT